MLKGRKCLIQRHLTAVDQPDIVLKKIAFCSHFHGTRFVKKYFNAFDFEVRATIFVPTSISDMRRISEIEVGAF